MKMSKTNALELAAAETNLRVASARLKFLAEEQVKLDRKLERASAELADALEHRLSL